MIAWASTRPLTTATPSRSSMDCFFLRPPANPVSDPSLPFLFVTIPGASYQAVGLADAGTAQVKERGKNREFEGDQSAGFASHGRIIGRYRLIRQEGAVEPKGCPPSNRRWQFPAIRAPHDGGIVNTGAVNERRRGRSKSILTLGEPASLGEDP